MGRLHGDAACFFTFQNGGKIYPTGNTVQPSQLPHYSPTQSCRPTPGKPLLPSSLHSTSHLLSLDDGVRRRGFWEACGDCPRPVRVSSLGARWQRHCDPGMPLSVQNQLGIYRQSSGDSQMFWSMEKVVRKPPQRPGSPPRLSKKEHRRFRAQSSSCG